MSRFHYPTQNLLRGRRRLDEIEELEILDDWTWDQPTNRFYMRIAISLDKAYPDIPQKSEWYIVSEESYPYGSLGVYPSITNSITFTFPHMESNHTKNANGLWRSGKLCVEMDFHGFGRIAPVTEPHTVDERLFWYVNRAILWLKSVASSSILQTGDFYELPDFDVSHDWVIAYNEDCVSLMQWEDSTHFYGIAKIRKQEKENMSLMIVDRFLSIDEAETIYCPTWGSYLSNTSEVFEDALWLRLPQTPVCNHWQAPMTFEQLKETCSSQGISLTDILQAFAPRARTGRHHLILFGFPVPKKIGESPCEMVWQALKLPILSHKRNNNKRFQSGRRDKISMYGAPPGFRPNEEGWWRNDIQSILTDDLSLCWLDSQNWSSESITARGKLPDTIARCNVAVIGSGSLGSMLCELLIRAGVTSLTCIDYDYLQVGNLCRHTLDLNNVYSSKSEALAAKLNAINPHARVSFETHMLTVNEKGLVTPDLSHFDIIIDTTGNDEVLEIVSTCCTIRKRAIFFSTAIGLGAKRIYMCLAKETSALIDEFSSICEPFYQRDREECAIIELPRDGIGCWHPLFPARADDMWLAACISLKTLESFFADVEHKTLIAIFENKTDGGLFAGYHPVEVKYIDAQ